MIETDPEVCAILQLLYEKTWGCLVTNAGSVLPLLNLLYDPWPVSLHQKWVLLLLQGTDTNHMISMRSLQIVVCICMMVFGLEVSVNLVFSWEVLNDTTSN